MTAPRRRGRPIYTARIQSRDPGYRNPDRTDVGTVADLGALYIAVPELDWLHEILIEVDPKDRTVTITVRPNNEDPGNVPELLVRPDLSFKLTS